MVAPGRALGAWNTLEPNQRKPQAATLAEVFQRSSSPVEGRHRDLSLRPPELRGLDHPSTRAWLRAGHPVLRTRRDGTTAAERLFGQKSRSLCDAILASVEIPFAPRSIKSMLWSMQEFKGRC